MNHHEKARCLLQVNKARSEGIDTPQSWKGERAAQAIAALDRTYPDSRRIRQTPGLWKLMLDCPVRRKGHSQACGIAIGKIPGQRGNGASYTSCQTTPQCVYWRWSQKLVAAELITVCTATSRPYGRRAINHPCLNFFIPNTVARRAHAPTHQSQTPCRHHKSHCPPSTRSSKMPRRPDDAMARFNSP
jgi:hypothetical protein